MSDFKGATRRFRGCGGMFTPPKRKTAQNAFKCDFRRLSVFGHKKTAPIWGGSFIQFL